MKYCKICLQPDTRPGLKFNLDNLCPACVYHKSLINVDWQSREKDLKKIILQYKNERPSDYDCIIGVSGGKDSLRQALYAKHVLNLNPLLVCLAYSPQQASQRGVDNLSNLVSKGFDLLTISPAPETWKRLTRAAFFRFCNIAKSTEYALFASVPKIALAYGIKLILWGENPALQIGDQSTMGKTGWDGNSVRNMNTLQGGKPTWIIDAKFKRKDYLWKKYK